MKRPLIATSLVLAVTVLCAQDTTLKGADETLLRAVRVVVERIAEIVGVHHPPSIVAIRADEPARLAESMARADALLPKDRAAARGRAWRDLGLGSGSEPADLVAAIESDLPGVTFDASRTRLLVDAERLRPDAGHGDPNADPDASVLLATGVTPDEPLVGHYAAHAMLDRAPLTGIVTTDALLARAALAEGSANLAALVLLFGGVGLEPEVFSGSVRPEDALGGRLVPTAMRSGALLGSLLEFVYLDGFAQSAALARQGGLKRLGQERARRVTTRDVLHIDRPAGSAVALPEPPVPPALGLRLADRDILGEQGVVSMVSLLTGKDNLGLITGDGWAADDLARFEPAGGPAPPGADDGLTIWTTRWQSADDVNDFTYALDRCLAARFPGEAVRDDPNRGGRVLSRTDRIYRYERAGLDVKFQVATPKIDARLAPEPKKKGPRIPGSSPKK